MAYCGCNYESYNKVFGEKRAKKEFKRYKKKGLRKETKILYEALKSKVSGLSVMEIGSGIGALAINLTKAGALAYMGAELSKPSILLAQKLVAKEKLENKIDFVDKDLIQDKNSLKQADLILSDKVVCCYPHMERFINATASKARKYYAIVYPKENVIVKIVSTIVNWVIQLTSMRGFHTYIHNTTKINKIIKSYGFERIFYDKTFLWEILVFWK